jgi:uncharacterized protein (TIGR02996 family)
MRYAVAVMSPERLALLKAILSSPEDDLPRLVFADWLEENGTTDADAARVEFIRLGCRSKMKTAITPREGEWLDENWQRLLVHTLAVEFPNQEQFEWNRVGRHLRIAVPWAEDGQRKRSVVVFSFMRGFALRIEHRKRQDYQAIWRGAATDEPLAYHRPERLITPISNSNRPSCVLFAHDWGNEVFHRVFGFDDQPDRIAKHFHGQRLLTLEERRGMLREAFVDDSFGYNTPPHCRLRIAVATAMTAIAREFLGLTPETAIGTPPA